MVVTPIAIGLGSNLGDRHENLSKAIVLLRDVMQVIKISSAYETAPMYVEDQPAFINMALLAETELPPLPLLRKLKEIEGAIGRKPAERYGPREIDVDLLAYGSLAFSTEIDGAILLQVPHPRTPERRFVLAPLHELNPNLKLPGLPPLADMLATTEAHAATVVKLDNAAIPIPSR